MITEHTNITCPDCHGALARIRDGEMLQYQCRVGHSYSPRSAVVAHGLTEENMLWAAVVAMEEGADLAEEVAKFLDGQAAESLLSNAQLKRQLAQRVRDAMKELRTPQLL